MAYHYDAPISAGDPQLDRLIEAPLPVALIFWQERAALEALSPSLLQVARQHAGRLIVARLNTREAPQGRRRFAVDQTPLLIGLRGGREVTRARLNSQQVIQAQLQQLLAAEAEASPSGQPIEVMGDAAFEAAVLGTPGPVLVEFSAPWLPLCQQQARLIEGIAREFAGRLRVLRINVEHNPHSAGTFAVQSLPTVLLLRRGEEIGRMSGVIDAGELRRRIEGLIR